MNFPLLACHSEEPAPVPYLPTETKTASEMFFDGLPSQPLDSE